ncbi:hypothetical protein [Nocardia sp. NPDC050793]|uniref:hypothetical protein n=1 Tax=Nocardia sp. NPDC050793 TaxID=3155159 RepID=UPI0033E59763
MALPVRSCSPRSAPAGAPRVRTASRTSGSWVWTVAAPTMLIVSGGVRDGGSGAGAVGQDAWWMDPELLVRGDFERVWGLLDSAPDAQARSVAAVYRASAHLHHDASPMVRRQLLALDAARYGHRELAARITAVPVDGGEHARWGVEWATASQVDSRFRYALTGWKVPSVATAVVDGRAVAVGPSWSGGNNGRALRVWDLMTGEQVGEPLAGHDGSVRAVATATMNARPVAITGSEDGTARVWDLFGHRQIGEPMAGHDGWVLSVSTALVDGRLVAVTGGTDHTARVWDLGTGRQIGVPLAGHSHWVVTVSTAVVNGWRRCRRLHETPCHPTPDTPGRAPCHRPPRSSRAPAAACCRAAPWTPRPSSDYRPDWAPDVLVLRHRGR